MQMNEKGAKGGGDERNNALLITSPREGTPRLGLGLGLAEFTGLGLGLEFQTGAYCN